MQFDVIKHRVDIDLLLEFRILINKFLDFDQGDFVELWFGSDRSVGDGDWLLLNSVVEGENRSDRFREALAIRESFSTGTLREDEDGIEGFVQVQNLLVSWEGLEFDLVLQIV